MALAVQNSMMTYQPSLGHWRCFVVDVKGWDEFQLTLAEPRSQLPVPLVGLPSLSGLPCLPRSSLVMPLVPFLVLSHGWVFVTEGFSVVLTFLVFFQEGLNDGVLVGIFHVEMSGCKLCGRYGFCVLRCDACAASSFSGCGPCSLRGTPCWVWDLAS